MVEIENWQDPELSEAVRIWTGHGDSLSPRRDTSMLRRRFGADSDRWIVLIESLANEFYETNANLEAEDLHEMWSMAIADFKTKYPDAPDDVTKALAWCYTFDNR